MTDLAAHIPVGTPAATRPKLDGPSNIVSIIAFFGIVGTALLFIAYSLYVDVDDSGTQTKTFLPYLLLFIALLIALGFEFVNGFHDTANAVATVIYTHTLPANAAVVWSGFFNFLGVVLSSGAVAFSTCRCCRSSSFSRSGAPPASQWCSRC
jgi:inorganic phosphate transporter, PiT family